MKTKLESLQAVAIVLLFSFALSHAETPVFEWDFEITDPDYGYAQAFAGQGSADCQLDIGNSGQVHSDYNLAGAAGSASLDTSNWKVQPNACWSYAGWEFGLGHDLERNKQQLVSDNLSEYQLSFDAWVQGTHELPAIVQVHLQDNSVMDSAGNPTTRVVVGNNREVNDGDRDPFMLSDTRRRYTMSLDQLGFSDSDNDGRPFYTQQDLTNYLPDITSLNIEIEPRGTSGVLANESEKIGIDNPNTVYLDNVQLLAPWSNMETTRPVSPANLFSWDFGENSPSHTYSHAFAGQGSSDCSVKLPNTEQVSAKHRLLGGEALTSLDSSSWSVAENACWSFVGWEFGMGHNMATQRFTSDDLSLYSVSFDAWIEGTDDLPAVVAVHLQDNTEFDASGNPLTRVTLGNNRQQDDDDKNPFIITNQRKSFTVSLASLGFADLNGDGVDDYSQQDFAQYFSSITSFNIEIELQGTAGTLVDEISRIGIDNNNVLRIDNVSFRAPHESFALSCSTTSAGDVDGNGRVEFADFLVVSNNFGQAFFGHTNGDLDCNGQVEFADFLVVADNFGQSVSAESVPEPTLGWLCGVAATFAFLTRRKLRTST